MRLIAGLFLLTVPVLLAETREEALKAAHQAGQLYESDPAKATGLGEKAYLILKNLPDPAPADLAACAGLTARTARLDGDETRARLWFEMALRHADPEGTAVVRSELADMLMRSGDLPEARAALGPTPRIKPPSPVLAQWYQAAAKLHLTCGLLEDANSSIQAAIEALPEDDSFNRAALAIDAAGIALRLGHPVTPRINEARKLLRTLDDPDPALITALTSVASQDPDLTPQDSLLLLQSLDLDELPEEIRVSYSVTLAEAALKSGNPNLAEEVLTPVLASDFLPHDHPLLARAFSLQADATGKPDFAKKSSRVALRWLSNSGDSDILLGMQRTVDPYSPIINHCPADLPEIALAARNFALRTRIGGKVAHPEHQTILYLLYQRNFTQRYGALIFAEEIKWVDLGPAEKIHQRISATLETAERTLGEVNIGTTLPARLTQLWKSLWEPVAPHLDQSQPIDIAPIGMLHAVPWSILRQRDGKYLCRIFGEARILALTGETPARGVKNDLMLIGVGNAPGDLPADGIFPFDRELVSLVKGLPALPGVSGELAMLEGEILRNPDRKLFLDALRKGPGTVHVAGHGFVIEGGEGHGFRAGLVLHGGGTQSILFAHEIASLDLSETNLVVLSTCRGGIGQGEIGGNWSSLRRSFIAAGVSQVLAAQWRVRDDHLRDFMARFHRKRKESPPHQALWSLQAELVEDCTDLELASAGAWILESIPSR